MPSTAPTPDAPLPYLQRIHDYYLALGYGAPYVWATFAEVPFQRLRKPLAECRIALVTTAAPFKPEAGDQNPGAPYNALAKFYRVYSGAAGDDGPLPNLRIAHVAIDRQHTWTDDLGAHFPLAALRRAAAVGRTAVGRIAAGRIAAVAPRFHGAPTQRSQRVTQEQDGPEIVARCIADGADAAILVANCPVCHQTVALVARLLEVAGIASVVMGCARDIVELVGVPRMLFSDFPLGNAAGRPNDLASQDATLALALDLLEAATAPRSTGVSPQRWHPDNNDWKLDYSNIARLSPQEIARRRAEFDAGKAQAKALQTCG